MKRKLILLLFFTAATVLSQNLLIEDFNYPERDSIQGLGGWSSSGLLSPYNVKVKAPGLSYTGYTSSNIGNSSLFTNNPNGSIVLRNFTTQSSGMLYMSLMIKADSLGVNANTGYNIGFDAAGGTTYINTKLMLQKVTANTFKMGISKTSGASYSPVIYNTNTTYLVVLKYIFVDGTGNDSCGLYVFTSGIPANEPASFDASTVSGTDITNQGQVVLSNMYGQSPGLSGSLLRIDGIRVGTTWIGTVFTAVEQISSEIPDGFSLGQNYPNPFNPSTKINYSVASGSDVKIKIYDMLAREVKTIVSGFHSAGTYGVELNGEGMTSGAYFYMMQAGDFVTVKKLILVK